MGGSLRENHAWLVITVALATMLSSWPTSTTTGSHPDPNPGGPLSVVGPSIYLNVRAPILVSFVSFDADSNNLMRLESPVSADMFRCLEVEPGPVFTSPILDHGELIFSLTTSDYTYYTGPGSRNPDGKVHARYTPSQGSASQIRIAWEDIFGEGDAAPGASGDFNDCVYDVELASTELTACFIHSASGLTISVDASCSFAPEGEIVSYAWDWGDGLPPQSGLLSSNLTNPKVV